MNVYNIRVDKITRSFYKIRNKIIHSMSDTFKTFITTMHKANKILYKHNLPDSALVHYKVKKEYADNLK